MFAPLPDIEVDTVTRAYIEKVVAYHWLPDAIVSDRGSQFVSTFWKRLCELLRINRRISTAFHPQTDGSTERMNSVWETYPRSFTNWAQDDWPGLCPIAQIAIRGRTAASTGVSPFFLQHGHHVDPTQLSPLQDPAEANRKLSTKEKSDKQRAEALVNKFRAALDMAQAHMAEAQQEQERQANKSRQEAPRLVIGDKVWLKLDKQLSTGRKSKKLDWRNAKYTVIEVINSHSVRINTPPGPNNVFHVDRLRLASTDPLSGQPTDDSQPLPIQVEGEDEVEVEAIVSELRQRSGRGWKDWVEVKWKGYHKTTMEPKNNLEGTRALEEWDEYLNSNRDSHGKLPPGFRRTP